MKRLEEQANQLSYQSTAEDEGRFVDSWKEDRLATLRRIHERRREYLDKGAGSLEQMVDEKELIKATANNARVVCHFYEEGFERCRILDGLLTSLASRFLDTKFVKIMATRAPFFTDRMGIRVLPTLLTLVDGNVVKVYVGFKEFGGDAINLDSLRNALLRDNVLTDECCILDGDSEDVESDPNN